MNLKNLNEKHMYRHKVSLYREAAEKQEDLSVSKKLTIIATDIPCLISPKKPDAPTASGHINGISEEFKLFANPENDILAGDVVEWEGRQYIAGEPFQYPYHLEVIIVRKDLA